MDFSTLEPPPKRHKSDPPTMNEPIMAGKTPKEPAPRKAPETLDLEYIPSNPASSKDHQRKLDNLLKVLRRKKKIVVVAGAGISVGAGIPDFRGAGGLFSSLKADHKLKSSGKELFDATVYRDSKLTSPFHDMVRSLDSMAKNAIPTEFHHLLATLAAEDRLLRLYTQNIDCIENQLPPLQTQVPLGPKGPWPKTIQLHGGIEKMVCTKCGWLGRLDAEIFRGSEPPDCSECVEMESVRGIAGKRSLGVGKLRPRIVLYNEYHQDSEAIGAVSKADLKTRPDALIVVGTSLKVPGIRRIVREMSKSVQNIRGGLTIWINQDEPPLGKELEGAFDLIVRGDCEEVAGLAGLPRWDFTCPMDDFDSTQTSTNQSVTPEYREVSESQIPADELEVQITHSLATLAGPEITGKKRKRGAGPRSKAQDKKLEVPEKPAKRAKKTPAPRKPRVSRKAAAGKSNSTITFKAAKKDIPKIDVPGKEQPVVTDGEVFPTPPSTGQLSPSPQPQINLEHSA